MSLAKDVQEVLSEPYNNGFSTRTGSSARLAHDANQATRGIEEPETPATKLRKSTFLPVHERLEPGRYVVENRTATKMPIGSINIDNAGTGEFDACKQQLSKELPSFSPGVVFAQINFLQGRILTVLDAIFADATQRKAAKDLIKGQFRDRISYMHHLIGDDSDSCSDSE
jgi:hypothetical protein